MAKPPRCSPRPWRRPDNRRAITLNQYQAGTVSYLNVVTAQATQLAAEQTAVQLLSRRLNASITLLKAAGGDWWQPREP